jgi:uncharacterized membrane protein YkvI
MSGKGWLILKVAAVYVSCVIGAGFASGQEIMQFFTLFGRKGLWGTGLAAILFSLFGMLIMTLAVKLRTSNYQGIYLFLLGKRLARLMDTLSLFMLPGSLVVMLTASGAIWAEQFGFSVWLGSTLTALITCLVITRGLRGIIAINSILVPLKIIFIILTALGAIYYRNGSMGQLSAALSVSNMPAGNWIWSGVLYVSYNLVLALAVLSSLGRIIPLEVGIAGGFVGGIVLGVTAALITAAELTFYPEITAVEVPLVYIAGFLSKKLAYLVGLLLWLAVLTTTIADAHGLACRLAPKGDWRYKLIGSGITLAVLPFAGHNFSSLVRLLYPLYGYLGLILLAGLIIAPIKIFKFKKLKRRVFYLDEET